MKYAWIMLGFYIGRYIFGRKEMSGYELRARLKDLDPVDRLRGLGLL